MLNVKKKIITQIEVISILEDLKVELKELKTKDINFLKKENILIDGGDYYFYPVIIDTEIEPKGEIFLVGVYLPFNNKYFSFIFEKDDNDKYISWIKKQLIDLFYFFKNNSFCNYKDVNNEEIYPILVGHNIIKYDFIILFHFLYINKDVKKSFNEILTLSNIIIESDTEYKYNIYKSAKNIVYEEIKSFFCLDTLLCINAGEAKSLFRFKTDIYFNSEKEHVVPLEFDLNNIVLKKDIKAIEHLCNYNLNDLYFNYRLIFFSSPKERVKSRCLLYKNLTPQSIVFAESLNKFDSMINCLYIVEQSKIDRAESYISSINTKININQCFFLKNYKYLDQYLIFFKNKNIYKLINSGEGVINIKNIQVNMGIGGLHSITQKISIRDNSDFYGSQLIFSSSNENYVTLILDFQSFYVNIILQLLDHIKTFSNEKEILKKLNTIRLELKKKKDPNDAIFKISTLAYTGSLNDYRSKVFFPKLYLSMTLNGQLLCLELLDFLSKKIEKIIEVNTDGVVIYIKKENYNSLMALCDAFEKDYNFKIDTRESIKCGLFFTANKKILLNPEDKLTIKGFKSGLGFGFITETLSRWIKNYKNLLENFNNSKEYKEKLYMSLWKSFCKQITVDKTTNNIKNYLNSETILKTKLIVYFSKNPDYFGGLPSKSKVILHPFPIKKLDFKTLNCDNNLKKNIMKDLDVSSYWLYLMDKIGVHFIYNINNNFEKIKPVVLDNNYYYLNNNKKMNINFFYLKNKKIILYFYLLSKLGFVVFMKDRDKKSFPKKKMSQSNLVNILNNNNKLFYKYMLENYTYGMCNGVAVCVNLKESWENDICCIDFDGVEWFFKKNNFNEKENLKQKIFLSFLLSIKDNGFLIYSSMTNTPFDRFKVFFKINNKPINLSYDKFKKIHKNSYLNFDFNIEDLSSICGSNLHGQQLINKYAFKELQVVDFENYNDFFTDQSNNLLTKSINIKDVTFMDLITKLFCERTYDQRLLYNDLFEGSKKVNIFNFNKYDIDKEIFIKIFITVIKKKNVNKLNIKKIDNIFSFYKFNYNFNKVIYKVEDKNQLEKKIKTVQTNNVKKIIINNDYQTVKMNKTFLHSMEEFDSSNYQLNFNKLDHAINILDEVFNFFNIKYGTSFKYTEIVDNNIIYHSNCIFKDDNNNTKQVTAYINKHLQCRINCYHDSCKRESRYKNIENSINYNLYSVIIFNSSTPFKIKDEEISNIINDYNN